MPLTITAELARSSGADAGDRAMRKAGRTKWSVDDYNIAVSTNNRLLLHVPFEQGGLLGVPAHMLSGMGLED